ncbi:hypothetical protein [Planotetraspora sp. GP83]|uniref:hypothetical protein n=1 Tax=Planotetraspora sp. GP83 TaxID=3156264 RepID=UPI003513CD82
MAPTAPPRPAGSRKEETKICDDEVLDFYLGTHRPRWLVTTPLEVSLFISHWVLAALFLRLAAIEERIAGAIPGRELIGADSDRLATYGISLG